MSLYLSILAGSISFAGVIPYIRDVVKGGTKPRVASWAVWAVLTAIATAAAFADYQYAAAFLAGCMTIGCTTVAIAGLLKNGRMLLEKFDLVCLTLALVGIILWQYFDSPQLGVIVVVIIDAIASLPTIRHAWKAPHEETLAEFLTAGSASLLTLIAGASWNITAIIYPLYIIVFDTTVALLIFRGRLRIAYNQKHEAITDISGDNKSDD